MGSSASAPPKANNYKQQMVEEIEGKEDAAYKAKCDAKQKEFEEIINDIEENIKKDQSLPNLIYQFSKVIELEGHDKLDSVEHMVKAMNAGWNGIFKHENAISEIAGKDQVAELKGVRCEYFLLLLKTSEVMVGLMEQSKIQKENIARMSQVAIKARDKGQATLSKGELADYHDGIKVLTKWIDESDLKDLIKEWNDLCKRLEEQKSRIQKLFDKYEKVYDKYKRYALWKKIAIGFGILVGLATIIGLAIATSGAAAAIAAGAVKTITIGTVKIVTAHAIVAGMSLGGASLLCAGGYAYGYYMKPDKVVQDIQRITDMLNKYIKNCERMQTELNKVGGVRTQINGQAKYLSDYESVTTIIRACETIDGYLDNYVTKGKVVITVIDKACQEFIQ